MLKRTSLYDTHGALGAKIVPFAGWEMPVHYGGILDEVRAVRSSAGIFDVSHMGEVRVTGPNALAALQSLLTNDASKLEPGRAQYTLMCREDGGILDDLIVYRSADDYLIVVNAGNRDADFEWMSGHTGGATFVDESDDWSLLAVQGPEAAGIVQGLVPETDLSGLKPFSFVDTASGMRLARTGYTGEDGFEIFCCSDAAPDIWTAAVNAGAKPCGLGARDVLRIEASYPLYGHEINTETNPYEAGLGWVVKPAKGDFIGRDAMVAAKTAGLTRKLRGILPDDTRAIPREGAPVICEGGTAGTVTSGTFSPTLERAVAMAYVPTDCAETVSLPMRGKELPARVVNLPFYKRDRA